MAIDVQGIMLDLIEAASFNGFDGPAVRKALEWRRNYWEAVLMTRVGAGITLRDLADGQYNVDLMYILPAPGRERELEKLAQQWGADEIKWIEGAEAAQFLGQHGTDKKILEIWWD